MSSEFILTLEMILGSPIPSIVPISIHPSDSTMAVADKIKDAIKSVDENEGVVIFTDMLGGTPSNVALSFLDEDKVEVISGLNLPMIYQVATNRETESLADLGRILQKTGRENISLASELLRGNGCKNAQIADAEK